VTTLQRVELLSRAYPRQFPRTHLLRLLRSELGGVNALDSWTSRDGVRVQALAPRLIYHISAGNLAISAQTSLMHGLLLGAHNVLKLPGDRDDATTRHEILAFVRRLPAALRKRVKTERTLNLDILRRADAIVAFGSELTMASLREQVRWDQKLVAHGPAVSLLWIAEPERFTVADARACATDILTYDQLGCLSPQAIYLPRGMSTRLVGDRLALALQSAWARLPKKPARPLAVAARVTEARDVALALGHRVWQPRHLGWTVIHDPESTFQPSPLHGVIYLREAGPGQLARALAPVAGRISTIGLVGSQAGKALASRAKDLFLTLGVSRFCPAGHMQFPPLTWHHDGQRPLAGLVTWINEEGRP
jgi:hypothetical protein